MGLAASRLTEDTFTVHMLSGECVISSVLTQITLYVAADVVIHTPEVFL